MKINVEYDPAYHTFKCKYKGTIISYSAEEIYGSLNKNQKPEQFVEYYYNQIRDEDYPLFYEIECY